MDEFPSTDDKRADNALRHYYRVLSEPEQLAIAAVKDAGQAFLDTLNKYCHTSREASLAVTKLEEAKMPLEKILKIAVLKGLDRDTIRTLRVDDNSNYRRALKEVQGA